MMTQSWAVLLDSLRLLRSRYLFWLTLGLSAAASVALFGTYTFTDKGIRFLWMQTWENPLVRAGTNGPRDFVAFLFNGFYVKFWLSWGAIILAILSTASILPDFLAGGAVEMSLSKPISRLRLLALKTLGAALFVLLQVAVGVGVAYLVIGLKLGMWLHSSLLAVPLITLQFLYLYSFCVLLAVVTRSTLACVLGTMLFWFMVFIVQFASTQVDEAVVQSGSMVRQTQARIVRLEKRAADENRPLSLLESGQVARLKERAASDGETEAMFAKWKRWLDMAEAGVPKTGDIQRILARQAEAPVINEFVSLLNPGRGFRPEGFDEEQWEEIQTASTESQRALRLVNASRSIGSSVAVSLFMLGLAAFIFARRDF